MVMKNRTSASRAGAARGRRRAGSLPSEGSRALPRRVLVRTLKTQVLSQLLSAREGTGSEAATALAATARAPGPAPLLGPRHCPLSDAGPCSDPSLSLGPQQHSVQPSPVLARASSPHLGQERPKGTVRICFIPWRARVGV